MNQPLALLVLLALAGPAAAAEAQAQPELPAAAERAPAPIGEADVAPLFSAGPLARARADLEAGRFEAAAQGFAASSAPEARYLRAVALVNAHRGADALKALAGLDRALPALADRIAWWRGRAQEEVGDLRAGARAYAVILPGSLVWPDAQLAQARALQRAGDAAAAIDVLAPMLSLPPPEEPTRGDLAAEALLLAGQLRAARRQGSDLTWARRAFLDCWAAHPLSGLAPTCLAELRRLPGSPGGPAPEDVLRRAEALLDANRNAAALDELKPLTPRLPACGPGEPLACRAGFAAGRALRRDRQHTRAMEALRPVVDRCDDPALRVRALYVLASAASIVAPDEAIGLYQSLARDYPANALADDALFYASDLLSRAGRVDEAVRALRELAERYVRGDFRAEALFRAAWLDRQAGRADAAIAALEQVERDFEATDPYEHARAAYWRARLRSERGAEGDAAAASASWHALVERYPADYYGLLARARLEEAEPGSAPPWPAALRGVAEGGFRYAPGPLAGDRHFQSGLALLRMGLASLAADELAAVDRKDLAATEPLLLVAELLDRAGDHRRAHNLVRTLGRSVLRQRPDAAALRVWRVAYPQAFRADVERFASAAGVAPELLLALMREESGLDPAVVSPAGAVGLTQLMPATAQGVARKLGMGKVQTADLMKAPISIRIGASYFGGLLKRYHGSEALALAAYNVGDTPVKGWLRARGTLPLDAFVEEIPVQETRGYVKRVLRSYAAYRYLYGAASDGQVLIGQALPPP